jgi:DNA-binding CsgD family transcriptional regulator
MDQGSKPNKPAEPPLGVEVDRLTWCGEELVVLSYPLQGEDALARLSDAEREVLRALLEGHTTAEIAASRGRAARTVANQVAKIFRKLGVGSRAELTALLSRPGR